MTPEAFYSPDFVADIRTCLSSRGVVCHNFHSGKAELDLRLEDACAAYAAAFPGAACRVPARRFNTIVAASRRETAFSASVEGLQFAAQREREERGILFDASARLDGLRRLG